MAARMEPSPPSTTSTTSYAMLFAALLLFIPTTAGADAFGARLYIHDTHHQHGPPTDPLFRTATLNISQLQWGPSAGPYTRSLLPRIQLEVVDSQYTGATGPSIQSNFDNGNIHVYRNYKNGTFDLLIRPDPYSSMAGGQTFLGKFLFRVTNTSQGPLDLRILNAGDVNVGRSSVNREDVYNNGWKARASYDYTNWFLVPTTYDNATGTLTIRFTPERPVVWFAYFPPYAAYRLEDRITLMSVWQGLETSVSEFGKSVLGQPLILIQLGSNCTDKLKLWVLSGQTAADSQGPWFVEGLADTATGPADVDPLEGPPSEATRFYDSACLYLVPALNADGMLLGNHRTNARGMELTRAWNDTSATLAPEVYYLQQAVEEIGVDFWLEVKGSEYLKSIFLYFSDGVCGDWGAWDGRFDAYRDVLVDTMMQLQPEYNGTWYSDLKGGFPFTKPATTQCQGEVGFSDSWIAQQYGVPATSMIIPFVDVAGFENATTGMTPQRARKFGSTFFDVLQEMVPHIQQLRDSVTSNI